MELINSAQTTQTQGLINGMADPPSNDLIRPMRKSSYLLSHLINLPSFPPHSQKSKSLVLLFVLSGWEINDDLYLIGVALEETPTGSGRTAVSHTALPSALLRCSG